MLHQTRTHSRPEHPQRPPLMAWRAAAPSRCQAAAVHENRSSAHQYRAMRQCHSNAPMQHGPCRAVGNGAHADRPHYAFSLQLSVAAETHCEHILRALLLLKVQQWPHQHRHLDCCVSANLIYKCCATFATSRAIQSSSACPVESSSACAIQACCTCPIACLCTCACCSLRAGGCCRDLIGGLHAMHAWHP
jgi:hypothetical protein